MVFFQCAGCGTDCKKNQVEKHKARCPRSDVFSCIDCSVEFRGQGYTSHTRCMTESQKYEAKNSTAATGSGLSKGDAKQEMWLNKISQAVADSASQSDQRVTKVLEKLPDYPNIPRKRAKLINFLRSSLRVNDQKVCEAVWDFLENAKEKSATPETSATTAATEIEVVVDGSSEAKVGEAAENEETIGVKDKVETLGTSTAVVSSPTSDEDKGKESKEEKVAPDAAESKSADPKITAKKKKNKKGKGVTQKEPAKQEVVAGGEKETEAGKSEEEVATAREDGKGQKTEEQVEKAGKKAKKRKIASESVGENEKKKKKKDGNGIEETEDSGGKEEIACDGRWQSGEKMDVAESKPPASKGKGENKKKKKAKVEGDVTLNCLADNDATIPAVSDQPTSGETVDTSVNGTEAKPAGKNKKKKNKKHKNVEKSESNKENASNGEPAVDESSEKMEVVVDEKPDSAVVDVSAAKTKEERRLLKKLKRKQRREAEAASGEISAKKKAKKEAKENGVVTAVTNGVEGKIKGKKKGQKNDPADKKTPVSSDSPSKAKKDKGKRFDIGRVIHAFLDACPSKTASFAQVTSRVLEEFKRIKTQPDMEEKRLVNKINKKIELNPNINIKNGEIILV